MSDKYEPKTCVDCGAIGVPRDKERCKPCRIGQEHGPEARKRYLRDLAERGGQATKAKRGAHALKVRQLPELDGHAAAKAWLRELAEGVASGQVSRGLSAELRRTLKAFMSAHKAHVTDEVVAEIREELRELRKRVEGERQPWQTG